MYPSQISQITNCGFPPLAFGLWPGLMPACCCCRGNGVIEMLGVEPLVLDFDDDEGDAVAPVSEDKNEELAAAAAGFNIASF